MGRWSNMTEEQRAKHCAESRSYYSQHKEEQKKVHRIWYEKHRDEISEKAKEYRKLHGDELRAKQKIRSRKHYYSDIDRARNKARERTILYRKRHRDELIEKRRELRREVVNHYGGKCACCGEVELKFLAIDHAGGGGNKHRRELKSKGGDGTVTCGAYGKCPHEDKK